MYTVDYFINKFQSIPEEFWCAGNFISGASMCANAHCGVTDAEQSASDEVRALKLLFVGLVLHYKDDLHIVLDLLKGGFSVKVACVNDGKVIEYSQPTPKQRILAALYDIKKAQQPQVKERIVYVTVDQPVRELQKQTLATN